MSEANLKAHSAYGSSESESSHSDAVNVIQTEENDNTQFGGPIHSSSSSSSGNSESYRSNRYGHESRLHANESSPSDSTHNMDYVPGSFKKQLHTGKNPINIQDPLIALASPVRKSPLSHEYNYKPNCATQPHFHNSDITHSTISLPTPSNNLPFKALYGSIKEEGEADSIQSSTYQIASSPLISTSSAGFIEDNLESANVAYPQSGPLSFERKLKYYVPCCNWMAQYTLDNFFHDLVAGLSLASYQIPLSMSFATAVAHVPTICGLLGLTVAPTIYMFLGSVPQMIVGPEAAVSMIVGQCIEKIIKHNPDVSSVDLLIVLASCSGSILLVFGLMRFGFIDNVLCSSLMKAFITAIGVTMMINSTISILGLDSALSSLPSDIHVHSPYQKLVFLIQHIHKFHSSTTAIGFSAFAALFIMKYIKSLFIKRKHKWASFFPEILVVVVFSTFMSYMLDFEKHGINVLGKVDVSGFRLKLPFTSHLRPWYSELFVASFTCAILGFFESSTAAKSLSSSTTPVSSNRELVALGSVSLSVSVFGGLPSFGGYARSKLNATNGARTPASGLFMGLTTLLTTLYLLDYIYYLPICVLNAVIAIVGLSLLKESPGEVKFHIRTEGYNELFTFFLTLVSSFFYTVELGVGIGTFYSLMRVIKHSTKSRIQILARVAGTDIFVNSDFVDDDGAPLKKVAVKGYKEFRRKSMIRHRLEAGELPNISLSEEQSVDTDDKKDSDGDAAPQLEDREGCLIIKIPEPLTFTNASDLKSRLKRIEIYGSAKAHPASKHTNFRLRHIVFDLHGMTSLDSSAAQIVVDVLLNYKKRGIDVFFCRVFRDKDLLRRLKDSGITGTLSYFEGSNYGIPQRWPPYYDKILDALKAIDCIEYRNNSNDDVQSYISSSFPYDGSA